MLVLFVETALKSPGADALTHSVLGRRGFSDVDIFSGVLGERARRALLCHCCDTCETDVCDGCCEDGCDRDKKKKKKKKKWG